MSITFDGLDKKVSIPYSGEAALKREYKDLKAHYEMVSIPYSGEAALKLAPPADRYIQAESFNPLQRGGGPEA